MATCVLVPSATGRDRRILRVHGPALSQENKAKRDRGKHHWSSVVYMHAYECVHTYTRNTYMQLPHTHTCITHTSQAIIKYKKGRGYGSAVESSLSMHEALFKPQYCKINKSVSILSIGVSKLFERISAY